MKKLIAAIAVIAATAGFSASAKENDRTHCSTPDCCPPDRECTTADCNCDSTRCTPRPACPFEDLNLTDEQKQKIQDLKKKQVENRKAKADNRRESREEAMRNELAQLKAILTPEQYTKLLENNFIKKNEFRGPRDGRHGDRRDHPRRGGCCHDDHARHCN